MRPMQTRRIAYRFPNLVIGSLVVFAAGADLGAVKAQDVSQPSNTATEEAIRDVGDQLQRRLAEERKQAEEARERRETETPSQK
jgi:hypothetical protein